MPAWLFRCAVWLHNSVCRRKPGRHYATEGRLASCFSRSEPKVCRDKKRHLVGGPSSTWEEGHWVSLLAHWTGHFFGCANARGGGRCSCVPSSATRYRICPCVMHCCAGSPLLVACWGGQPFAGSVAGGITVPPGLAGGKSAAAIAAPPSSVSGSRAACESTASSFSWVGSTGATCLGGCAGLFGWVRPVVFRLGEASSFRGGLLCPVV